MVDEYGQQFCMTEEAALCNIFFLGLSPEDQVLID